MKTKKSITQFSFYALFGLMSLGLDLIIYLLLTELLFISASLSKIVSFISASINSFILNKRFTFKIKEFYVKQPIKFFLIYSLSLFFNSSIHNFLDKSYDGLIPFGIATFISVIINFSGQKFWVFRN